MTAMSCFSGILATLHFIYIQNIPGGISSQNQRGKFIYTFFIHDITNADSGHGVNYHDQQESSGLDELCLAIVHSQTVTRGQGSSCKKTWFIS